MQFGNRYIEADEPVLYFENVNMSMLSEKSSPIMARGGWGNMPKVIWEDRDIVQFQMSEGVMSSIGMSILLSANVTSAAQQDEPLLVNKREGPFSIDSTNGKIYIEHWPVPVEQKKTFIFEYGRQTVQKKIYGKRIYGELDPFDPTIEKPCIQLYEDKELTIPADADKEYMIDYYYQYTTDALIYTVQKERFNGLFTLEGKFYSKDENDGMNYTNILRMPKVRVVSDINLRLGERADPTMSAFNIIGLPERAGVGKKSLILEITRLDKDIDDDI